MTPRPSTAHALQSFEPTSRDSETGAVATPLALLQQLESSLEASQRALLDRDLARIEEATRDQVRLQRRLEEWWAAERSRENWLAARIRQQNGDHRVAGKLRAAQSRVLFLGRVQAALLARAQRSLRTISYLLAGQAWSYGPSLCPQASTARLTSLRGPEKDGT